MIETVAALAALAGASVAAVAVNVSWRMMMPASEQRLVEGSARVYVVRLVMEVVKLVANTMTAFVEILRLVADSLVAVFQKRCAGQLLPNWTKEHPERAPGPVKVCEDDGFAVEGRGMDRSGFLSSKPAGRADLFGGTSGLLATVVAASELQAWCQGSSFSVVPRARRSIYS